MKLFPRIFLTFWLATVLMIVVVLGVNELLPLTFRGDRYTHFEPQQAQTALREAVNIYERRGQAALSSDLQSVSITRHRHVYLFNQEGKVLIGRTPAPLFYEPLARDVLRTGHAEMQQYFGFRMLYVCPVQSATGRRYAAVLIVVEPTSRLLRLRFWFNLAIALLSTALVCLGLSLYLTRPVTQLQASAKRLASGDLSARADPLATVRGDELGNLARDFDVMASQIQLLMTAQRRFVADVSHELGAPLTRMHLALALLRRRLMGMSGGELERLGRETDRLSSLVKQLLLLAGLEAGSCPEESLAPVSMQSLCASIIEDANFEAAHANCLVTGSRQDITLLAYPQLLRRAIDNVLRNAIRYAPPGTEIVLGCKAEATLQHVILEILDSGPGVPESMLADIFRPFFRTAPGRERKSGGTGLGLAIAAEAIRLHDGTITAKNRKSGGLQVTITLPLKTPAEGGDRSRQTPGILRDPI
jgi:two-component system, OmpR family, sensor histidine kinase CpxA